MASSSRAQRVLDDSLLPAAGSLVGTSEATKLLSRVEAARAVVEVVVGASVVVVVGAAVVVVVGDAAAVKAVWPLATHSGWYSAAHVILTLMARVTVPTSLTCSLAKLG
jgi:hypothetical protein